VPVLSRMPFLKVAFNSGYDTFILAYIKIGRESILYGLFLADLIIKSESQRQGSSTHILYA